MSRIALSQIPSITFYENSFTLSRRGASESISQLTCIGHPCKLFKPDVVRCDNIGGQGTEVDWKCEADLPEALRFGRVEVSCEGWSGPGDEYVMKGSCALRYRLVEVPRALRTDSGDLRRPSIFTRWFRAAKADPGAVVFNVVWVAVLLLILYSFLKSCFGSSRTRSPPGPRPYNPSYGRPSWFPGGHDYSDPPPPYPKPSTDEGWRPGFWTGAALGGLGTHLFNSARRPQATRYDWERDRFTQGAFRPTTPPTSFTSGRQHSSDDRGEGSSNLGSMRRSTGFGGSNVR